MEVISTTRGGIAMDELLLDVDLEDAKDSEMLLKSEPDDSNAEKPSTDLVMETEDIEPLPSNGDGDDSPSEPKWLQEDEPIALWVKWRGKWQAGIRCARADWPLTTLRGKPTHERKKYFVIFFPHTKNYSWADMQLVRSIDEFPDPIAYKSHKIGVKMVKDLTVARRNIMRKLTIRMLKIVDQFHSEVVVEAAKDIIFWKEFAMEASRSTSYHDLGRMLVKLQSMILQRYMDRNWLENSFCLWIQKCNDAVNAESIELLNEELDNCIRWSEVKSVADSSQVQLMVLSEWKTWKHDTRKWFSISRRTVGEVAEQSSSKSVFDSSDVQASRKRPKLEIRRAETTNASPQGLPATDSEFFSGRDEVMKTPENGLDLWDGIVVEAASGSQVVKTNEMSSGLQVPVVNEAVVVKKPFGSGNKSQQCTAFIEAKGRQCVRWANEGDIYCCVHLASRFTPKSAKNEGSPAVETPMCGGTTVLGTKCKHRSLPGMLHCKKHRPHSEMEEKPVNSHPVKRKVSEVIPSFEPTRCQDLVTFREMEGSSVSNGATSFAEMLKQCSNEDNLCVGSCSENSYVSCQEFATKHTLYCEQHLPNWLKRARNGKSRIISKEVFVDLLRSCSSRKEKLPLHQACEIFYKLFKSLLSLRNPVPMDLQLQWAISEASREADAGVGEFLMKLVSHEKERLARIWGFGADDEEEEDASMFSYDDEDDDDGDEEARDGQKLSFGGFACAICLDSFVNRKLLETHVEERHHVQFAEKCMLLRCIPCGSNFGDQEQLLVHVQAVHPSQCKTLTTVAASEPSGKPGSQMVASQNRESADNGGVHKYVCKFCGLNFNLLPDLGRHHQAEHMGPDQAGSRGGGPKKGLRFNTYMMKSGRLSRPSKYKKTLGAVSYRIRNRAGVNMKRRMQGSKPLGTEGKTGLSPLPSENRSFDATTDAHCSVVSEILFSKAQKVMHRPNNLDILSAARSACCKVSLETSLEAKFGVLPERIYLKAAKLCGEHGVQVQWHQEGYVCSNGCKPFKDPSLLAPLIPRQENDRFSVSMDAGEPCNKELEVDECHCIMEGHHFSKRPFGKTAVLCSDVSFGKEPVPISCVVDEELLNSELQNEKPWESCTYVTRSMLHPSMDLAKENLQLRCGCWGTGCSPLTCDHVYLFGNDFEEARDIFGKSMRCRFPYDDKERIILEEGYPVYECNELCGCPRTCQNRVLQNGIRVKLEVFRTESKGWGLRACEHILRGTFVCEFIGEVLDQEEASRRRYQYGKEGCSYIHDIDANINDIGRLIEGEPDYVLDATTHGNVSRFINHSCSPNLVTHQVVVESMESPLAHIGFYASVDIAAGEEITRDYGRRPGQENEHQCHCRAINCRGRFC